MPVSRRVWLRAAAALLLASAAPIAAGAADPGPTEEVTIETANGSHTVRVEIAETEAARQTGLMHRTSMDPDAGMLFLWDRPTMIGMWMKDTYIPLDMLFLSTRGVVIRIAENTEPHSLTPIRSGAPVLGVLELNAGSVERFAIKVGDRVRHPRFAAMQR